MGSYIWGLLGKGLPEPVGCRNMASPNIALVISTYQQAHHLRRVLASVAGQQGLDPWKTEVVVADDGSTDETSTIVSQYARSLHIPLRFTTHPHDGFQLSRCRNEGVRATTAEYLLFLDGDCLIPPDHVARHLWARRQGTVMAGNYCRLDEPTTKRITEDTVRSGEYLAWIPRAGLRSLARTDRKSRFYSFIHHPTKPRLIGCNIGIWRADYERVNGFDERFRAWGGEDDDLRLRLRRAGVRIQSILRWTRTYHLWHPSDITAPKRLRDGTNMAYLHRDIRLTRCASGLVKRQAEDLDIRFVGDASHWETISQLLPPGLPQRVDARRPPNPQARADIEILVAPSGGHFSGRADCNVLLALGDSAVIGKLARKAHLVLSDRPCPRVPPHCRLGLHEFARVLDRVLGHGITPPKDRQDLENVA